MSLQRIEGPKKCFCGKDPAPTKPGERYGTLCFEHREAMRVSDVKLEEERRAKEANAMRDMLIARVDEAVPDMFNTMRVVSHPDLIQGMFRDRIHVADPCGFYSDLMDIARDALRVRGLVVVFAGPTGIGKSHALALFLRMVAYLVPTLPPHENFTTRHGGIFHGDWDSDETNPYVMWDTASLLFKNVTKHNADTWKHENVPIFALDDVGREGTQVNATPVQDVLWARHDEQRLLAITTGFVDPTVDPTDVDAFFAPLARRYDEAAVRRLVKIPGRCRVIPMLPSA